MIEADLPEDAARAAYIACFHMAQAMIFETSGKIAKTHKGVHASFHLQITGDAAVSQNLRSFLRKSYRYKYTADYAVGFSEEIAIATAAQAVAKATDFLTHFTKMLE